MKKTAILIDGDILIKKYESQYTIDVDIIREIFDTYNNVDSYTRDSLFFYLTMCRQSKENLNSDKLYKDLMDVILSTGFIELSYIKIKIINKCEDTKDVFIDMIKDIQESVQHSIVNYYCIGKEEINYTSIPEIKIISTRDLIEYMSKIPGILTLNTL